MTIDYDKIVKDFNIGKLTKKKITASFIRKNFKEEIADLRLVLSVGNGNLEDNEEFEGVTFSANNEPEVINQTAIEMGNIFMGQEMPTDVWLGFVKGMIKGEFVRTVNDSRGLLLVSYDKTEPVPEAVTVAGKVGDISETEIVSGLKKALIKRF